MKHIKQDTTNGDQYSGWNNVIEIDGVVWVKHTEANTKCMGFAIICLVQCAIIIAITVGYVASTLK